MAVFFFDEVPAAVITLGARPREGPGAVGIGRLRAAANDDAEEDEDEEDPSARAATLCVGRSALLLITSTALFAPIGLTMLLPLLLRTLLPVLKVEEYILLFGCRERRKIIELLVQF